MHNLGRMSWASIVVMSFSGFMYSRGCTYRRKECCFRLPVRSICCGWRLAIRGKRMCDDPATELSLCHLELEHHASVTGYIRFWRKSSGVGSKTSHCRRPYGACCRCQLQTVIVIWIFWQIVGGWQDPPRVCGTWCPGGPDPGRQTDGKPLVLHLHGATPQQDNKVYMEALGIDQGMSS